MKILKTVTAIQRHLNSHRRMKKTIGFVPTMGALHAGHLSLLRKSVNENDITVISIFVNPTQFNEKADLIKYPRDLQKDALLLKSVKVDYIFAPSVSQIYPIKENHNVDLDISHLTKNMEGPNRPGHFEGVVQVVHRLLEILEPDHIYMGQKDFQQFSIIRYMLKSFKMKTKLKVCSTMREEDGLAMSSRNVRLTPETRTQAHIIYDNLIFAKNNLSRYNIRNLENKVLEKLKVKNFVPEYFNIVDGYTLEEIKDISKHKLIVAGTAVWANDVRLIDNMILRGEKLIQ